MKSPVALLSAFVQDARRLEPHVKDYDRDLVTIVARFKHEGYGFLSVALPSLGAAIDLGLSTGTFACPTGFEQIRSGALPKFLQGLLCDVFEPKSGVLKLTPNVGAIALLRELCYMFKKTQTDGAKEKQLHQAACREFIECDERIVGDNQFPSQESYHLDLVTRYLLPSLSMEDSDGLVPKHGPGAVSEGLTANQKWSAVWEGIQQDADLIQLIGMDNLLSMEPSLDGQAHIDKTPPKGRKIPRVDTLACTAKFVTVAKNSTSRRGITVEPVLRQFVQQALNTRLRSSIEQCHVLNRCLALTDQSFNQKLALIGSLTDSHATIDLKSASDLLGLSLVRKIFGRRPEFLQAMIDCRSSQVKVDESVYSIWKYAGMGNATTFPVQSIVFAALSIAAIIWQGGKKPSYGVVKRAARRVRVYGDDIVVETQYAREVCRWLSLFGLQVNQRKSFLVGNFKESCGVDAFAGVDLTPVYLRSPPDKTSPDASDFAHWVSFSNACWIRGLYSVSAVIKDLVESYLGRLPLVSSSSASLGWVTRQGTQEFQRWNPDLHRPEVKGYVVTSRKRFDPLDGYPALIKFLTSASKERSFLFPSSVDSKHLERSPERYKLRLAKRWVAA